MGNLVTVSPYANQIVCVKATGQEIADALEYGCRMEPETTGGFLQVSGLTYLTGIISGLGYAVKSNQENGLGRSDIDVREKRRKRGMLLEAKKSDKRTVPLSSWIFYCGDLFVGVK